MPDSQPAPVDVVLVHSSDLHVDDDRIAQAHGGDGTAGLAAVLARARANNADVVLLAGDTFDNNRVPSSVIDRAGRLLADAGSQVIILPGNHDPALANSVFVRGGYASIPNVAVIGITHDEAVPLPVHDLEIWGHAHRDYENMVPLRGPRPRSTRWQIAIAHGHYEPPHNLATPLRPSWLFSDDAIDATAADYLALGHWDRAVRVGNGGVPAYYSGSPELAQTVNLITLTATGQVMVKREPLRWDHR
jgi:DNA repair exonuclease SbcCD nuclease subunit